VSLFWHCLAAVAELDNAVHHNAKNNDADNTRYCKDWLLEVVDDFRI